MAPETGDAVAVWICILADCWWRDAVDPSAEAVLVAMVLDGGALAPDELDVLGVVAQDEDPAAVATVRLDDIGLALAVGEFEASVAVMLDGDSVVVADEVLEDVVLGEVAAFGEVVHGGEPAALPAVVLALVVWAVGVPVAGELDVIPAAELPVSRLAPAEDDTDAVVAEEGVAGAPNALAVGMSTSVTDAADTPSSRCVPVRT